MKTRFSNREVAHVWASQQQANGRSGNIFFEGPSIYSYGHHFEMARFVTPPATGVPEIVLVTTRSYSVTTASHLSRVKQAISHLTSFTVPSFTDHAENLAYLIAEAQKLIDSAKRARSSWKIERVLEDFSTDHIRHYAKLFGLPLSDPPRVDTELVAQLTEKLNQCRVREHEAQEKKDAKRQAQRDLRIKEEAAKLEAWKRGESLGWHNFASTALRINGNDIETTHGARVPLEAAKQFYTALRTGMNLTGIRVGMYTIQSVTAEVAVIGCHEIPMAEIERIEKQVMSL